MDSEGKSQTWSKGLIKLVMKCNNFMLEGSSRKTCLPFYVCGNRVGLIRPDVLTQLQNYPEVFRVMADGVHFSEHLVSVKDRDREMEKVLEDLRQKDILVSLGGWRNEKYSIYYRQDEPPLMNVERSGTCLFGFLQYGVHINGYTYKNGELYMWIGRRSKTKPTFPNMLDNMCAGGLAEGLGIRECAIKECQEEASVSDQVLEKLKSVTSISYLYEDERGIFPETQYVFDLELPENFHPKNADGEVASFQLLPIEKVKDLMISEEFKPNCAVVILDFLVRHSLVTPDSEPNYCYLVELMHTRLQPLFD